MADKSSGNPLVIDGSNNTARNFLPNDDVIVQSYKVIASADTWSFRILDANGGNTTLRDASNIANMRAFNTMTGPTKLRLGYISNLTNIAEVIIYQPYDIY
jgi:hypothetical protein